MAIQVEGTDGWGGDPLARCHEIAIRAGSHREAERLAPLLDLLTDADEFDRLLEHAAERRRSLERVRLRTCGAACAVGCAAGRELAESFGC